MNRDLIFHIVSEPPTQDDDPVVVHVEGPGHVIGSDVGCDVL